jgi:hypothetical protein
VLGGGTAGEPCGEPWTAGRLAAVLQAGLGEGARDASRCPLGDDECPHALPCRCLPDGRQLQCLDEQHLALLPAEDFDRRARIQRPPDALRGRLVP